MLDDPELTVRHWKGLSPVRLVIDMDLRLPASLKLFDQKSRTIIFNSVKHEMVGNTEYFKISKEGNIISQIVNTLYELNIQTVLVEGGARLLQSFIDEGVWDEIRKIENEKLEIEQGLVAPVFNDALRISEFNLLDDKIEIYKPRELSGS